MKVQQNIKCKLCGCNDTKVVYDGRIREGALGNYTSTKVKIWKCENCGVLWHDMVYDLQRYYGSKEYRLSLEHTTEEEDFYKLHDKESMEKFKYTGTKVFRNKTVADIGCGCGGFLDYVNGVASKAVAIEPSEYYQEIMKKKGFIVFPYAQEAISAGMGGLIDVVISFDVIEHVEDPCKFFENIHCLLSDKGQAIIGTPTDAPVMRNLLGEDFEMRQLFSTQHLWIFNEKSLRLLVSKIGFSKIRFKYFQRYGFSNFLGWVREKRPRSEIYASFITETLDNTWKNELERLGLSDYIVLYLTK